MVGVGERDCLFSFFKTFSRRNNMAVETKCQTPGANFKTTIGTKAICVEVTELPLESLTVAEAELLEANLHNVIEIVLSKYFDLQNS